MTPDELRGRAHDCECTHCKAALSDAADEIERLNADLEVERRIYVNGSIRGCGVEIDRLNAENALLKQVAAWAEGAGDACWCQQEDWRNQTHLGKALTALRSFQAKRDEKASR